MCRHPHVTTDLPVRDWDPVPQLRHRLTDVPQPAVPVIDAHNHLGRWLAAPGTWMIPEVSALIDTMDERGVTHIVNLDGRWGAELDENLDRYDRSHPERFSTFCHLDWSVFAGTTPTATLIRSLEASARAGARGLKVWKDLGLHVRDDSGDLVLPDDARLIPVWEAAGELGLPICIHTADPVAFFEPLDHRNERLDELGAVPDWWFGDTSRYPTFTRLIEALEGAVAAAPATRFMGAHVGCFAEDLDWVDTMLRSYPNFAIDIGGRLAEIGRQPRRFRRLVMDHPDRVIFGTDCFPVSADDYALHFRFCETADEHFAYWTLDDLAGDGTAPQGRWRISGLELPVDALTTLYAGNARSFLGVGIAA